MKTLGIFLLLACSTSPLAMASRLDRLENAQGEYLVKDQSDTVCQTLKQFDLRVVAEDAIIDYVYENPSVGTQSVTETFNDINTRKYTSHNLLNAVVYNRNIFKGNKLIKQESVWGLGIFPARYKDKRVVLEIKDNNTVVYNLTYYGTKTCELIRI